jgi:hypothetical protein
MIKIGVIVPGQWRTFDKTIELFHENVVNHTDAEFHFYYRFKTTTEEQIALGGRPLNWKVIESLSRDPATKLLTVAPNEPLHHLEGIDRMWGYDHEKLKNNYWQSIKGQHDAYKYLMLENDTALHSYSITFMLRTDYHIRQPLNLLEYDDFRVYIPAGEEYCDGYNDQCYWGATQLMEQVCCRCYDWLVPDRARHPETALKEFCELNWITVDRPKIDAGIGR